MAVSLREYPKITGKDAKRFLAKTEQNKNNIKRIAEAKLSSLPKYDKY